MTVDLTKNPNTYSYYLEEALPRIKEMFYDKSVTFNEMLDFVRSCVLKANDTTARRRFLEDYLPTCYNKTSIESLCYNTVKKAKTHDDGK